MLYRCILSRDLCGRREEKRETTRARGNTYDFIILTLIHIHRAATYVPLFICLMLATTRRVRKTSFHAATGGGINYLSSRVILPRSREVAPFRKSEISLPLVKSNFVARGECRVPFLSRAADSRPRAIYIHSWSNKQPVRARR